jgi:hypothetical protein
MSDVVKNKKGMRTFASDFARAKETRTPKSTPVPPAPQKPLTPLTPTVPVAKQLPTTQTTNASTRIPAFHELQKAVTDIGLTDKTSIPKQPSTPKVTINQSVGGGAIITDTRTHSFSLFRESKKSINAWFKNRKKKPTPRLAVADAGRRKGVIQQATTKSGTIFTADSETLRERILERNRQSNTKKPETSWSPYTEPGYDLLPAATKNVVVEFKKRSVPAPPPPTISEPSEPEYSIESHDETAPEPVEVTVPVEAEMMEEIQVLPVPIVVPPPVPEEPEEIIEAVEVPVEAEEPEVYAEPTALPLDVPQVEPEPEEPAPKVVVTTDSETELLDRPAVGISTNQLTLYISAGLALVLVTIFFVWFITNVQNNPSTPASNLTVSSDIDTVRYLINDGFSPAALRSYTGTQQFTTLVLVNEQDEILPSALVFDRVIPDLPVSIRQHVTAVRFIQYDTSIPQLVLTISDSSSVTGAMLSNEARLFEALEPIYGNVLTGPFVDQTISGVDVRTLRESSLTYGIINGNTLVIALSPETFANTVTVLTN